ncbi:MAG: hypothetical protein U9R25_20225 [Chloroflexota bacterium]|nr:hypothetical protein [Chloroflexota bacterium]
MRLVAPAVQQHLPDGLTLARGRVWSFGAQLYDDNPPFHYEIVRVPKRMGDRLELGLHFESRSRQHNVTMLSGFSPRLLEIKGELGGGFEAELWDRGWTKVYETVPLEAYETAYLDMVAQRMGAIIRVLHPIYRSMRQRAR